MYWYFYTPRNIVAPQMMHTVAYFKNMATGYDSVIQRCNCILNQDYGTGMKLKTYPDLLVVACDSDNVIQGFMVVHHADSTDAWEIGAASVVKGQSRNKLYSLLIQGTHDAVRVLMRHGIVDKAWMVRRVNKADMERRQFFERLGFLCPDNWMDNLLSDQGYVPFDPFDTLLMKREVVVEVDSEEI